MSDIVENRLPGLEDIRNPPTSIFTLNLHMASREVLREISVRWEPFAKKLGKNAIAAVPIRFVLFYDVAEVREYLERNRFPPDGVLLIDEALSGKKYSSPVLFGENNASEYPYRAIARWGMKIDPHRPGRNNGSIACQILTHFRSPNFMKQINAGRLPWGPVRQLWNIPEVVVSHQGQSRRSMRRQYFDGPALTL